MLLSKPLFLVGYMGCGKSTLARKLGRRLSLAFADTDTLVEQREGASVADIFYYEGEESFRVAERAVLDEAIAGGVGVISTGGGLPSWHDNMEHLNTVGMTIYLRRPAEQIARRMSPYGRQKRPRLRGLSDEELLGFMQRDMAEREQFYSRAQLTIDCTSVTDEELVERILEYLKDKQ